MSNLQFDVNIDQTPINVRVVKSKAVGLNPYQRDILDENKI